MSPTTDNNGAGDAPAEGSQHSARTSGGRETPMILKRTAEYMMRNSRVAIPSTLMAMIDMTLWFVDMTKESITAHATTAIARAIGSLSEEGRFDYNLLEAFQEIFEGWNKEMFDKLTMEGKRILKQFLREGGVYTGRKNGGIAAQLAELLTVEDLPEWNMEEFKRMTFDERSKAFQEQPQNTIGVTPAKRTHVCLTSCQHDG